MKILHLFSSKVFSGLERHVEELAFEQSKNDDVLVVGPIKLKGHFRSAYEAINTNQWRFSPILNLQLKKVVNQYQPDIVHTHAYKTTDLIAKQNNKKFFHVATIHGTKKRIKAFEKAEFIFGASKRSLENIKNPNNLVLENWVDESRFENFKKSIADRYIYVGRLEQVKNPMRLLKAWRKIKHKLDFYGDGPLRDHLLKYIKQNNLDDRVCFMGEEQDVKKIYRNAKAVLISSDREGSPKVLFESLFCNIPVLSTKTGIMPDILPASCVSEANDDEFAELLVKWIDQPNLLATEQHHLYTEIKQKNTLSIQSDIVLKKYQEISSKASR